MTDPALKASAERFFDLLQARLKRDFDEASDEDGMISIAQADAINARYAALMDEFFDKLIAGVGEGLGPIAADALRAEFEPWRVVLWKTILERRRPH